MNKCFLNSVASNFKINFWSINFLNPKFDFMNLTIKWKGEKRTCLKYLQIKAEKYSLNFGIYDYFEFLS